MWRELATTTTTTNPTIVTIAATALTAATSTTTLRLRTQQALFQGLYLPYLFVPHSTSKMKYCWDPIFR